MRNRIGETVIFNKDLQTPYFAELIDDLEVYNPSLKKIDNCEHWGANNEGQSNMPNYDFGRIADFHFEISSTETKLYYGDMPMLGYFEDNKTCLVLLPVASNTPDMFHTTDRFRFSKTYPKPKTMWDLTMFIDDFLACRLSHLHQLKKEHSELFSNMIASVSFGNNNQSDDDLPF